MSSDKVGEVAPGDVTVVSTKRLPDNRVRGRVESPVAGWITLQRPDGEKLVELKELGTGVGPLLRAIEVDAQLMDAASAKLAELDQFQAAQADAARGLKIAASGIDPMELQVAIQQAEETQLLDVAVDLAKQRLRNLREQQVGAGINLKSALNSSAISTLHFAQSTNSEHMVSSAMKLLKAVVPPQESDYLRPQTSPPKMCHT